MYGNEVGGATRQRMGYVPQPGADFGMSKAEREQLKKASEPEETEITVQALWDGKTYAVVVDSDGRQATLPSVKPEDLANEIARVLKSIAKAVANGTLKKSRHGVGDSSPLGLGTPTSNRSALRF